MPKGESGGQRGGQRGGYGGGGHQGGYGGNIYWKQGFGSVICYPFNPDLFWTDSSEKHFGVLRQLWLLLKRKYT